MTLLDSELNKLKAIGLKEISKSTKLASSKIEDVLEKRFDKLDKVRAKGFIAILEREYDVDLRDWIYAQQNYMLTKEDVNSVSQVISKQDNENKISVNKVSSEQKTHESVQKTTKVKDTPKQDGQESKPILSSDLPKAKQDTLGDVEQNTQDNPVQQLPLAQEDKKVREHHVLDLALKNRSKHESGHETYTWLYVVLVIILLVLMGYFAYRAFLQDYSTQHTSKQSSNKMNESKKGNGYDGIFFDATQNQGIGATQEKQTLDTDSKDIQESQAKQEDTNQESKDSQTDKNMQTEAPNTQDSYQKANSHPEQNFFFNPAQQSNNASNQDTLSPQISSDSVSDNVLHITSSDDLWIGLIHLDSGVKEQFAYKRAYDIPLSGRILFVMGHSSFELKLNGKDIAHGSKRPVRMYYDGSNLSEVGYSRFKELNGGAEW